MVLGDDPNRVFAVEISNAKTVSALRETIKDKKKPAFDHVPADALVLWNVSIPVERNLEENVNNFFLANEESLSLCRSCLKYSRMCLLGSTCTSS